MNVTHMISGFGLYLMAAYHYKMGYLRNRDLISPFFDRPSLERYKDSENLTFSSQDREIHSSTTDPNISSRLKRR